MTPTARKRWLWAGLWATLALNLAVLASSWVCIAGPPWGGLFEESEFRFRTEKLGAAPVVLLMGDSGSASPELRENFRAMAREPAVVALHAGDVTYRAPKEYGRFVKEAWALPFPLLAVPGDHDRDLDYNLIEYERQVGGRNRVAESGGLRVILLDTSTETVDPESFRFLEEALAKPPKPHWTIVVTHCPPYQPGLPFPKSLGKGHAIRDPEAARRLLDLCREAKVTLLATGHIHAFRQANEGGVPLVISGGGGKDVEPGESFHYVRVTLSDPIRVEQVVTTPGSGREPIVRMIDAAIAHLGSYFLFVLITGPLLGAVFGVALRRARAAAKPVQP